MSIAMIAILVGCGGSVDSSAVIADAAQEPVTALRQASGEAMGI